MLTCPAGSADCNGVDADGCETRINTSDHCGDCNTSCARPHQMTACEATSCMFGECEPGFKDCNMWASDGCETDITSDLNSCGDCKKQCVNPHGTTSCSAKTCMPVCDSGFAVCDKDPVGGCTVDLSSDPQNCGACGHACKGGACMGGMCTECLDTKPVVNSPCNNAMLVCGPYGWVGSPDMPCLCFCVNSKFTCRIKTPDGNGC
jgi:hypothetical protein